MITFITDERIGEPDILTPVNREALRVTQLDGQLIETIPAPIKGWTHEALESAAEQLAIKTRSGAEAYLGDAWVGCTEV